YAGWSSALGNAILDGRETLATLEARVASGEIDPKPVSGHQEQLENAVNQVIWTADQGSPVEPGAGPWPAADPDRTACRRGPRPRHRRLDDRDQGRPDRRRRPGRRRRQRRVRLRGPTAALERAGARAVVDRRDRRHPVRAGVDRR